ncbi:hypothetical protein [Saccharicrinis aurantiacus]|uniref:hypothetical protein n=1 Tax=Saccharicrinis aurantiacus TaxID=1849719 RepID=UPI002491B300|nr:hypothetical protein [Saccharicrinis aurantiacus]
MINKKYTLLILLIFGAIAIIAAPIVLTQWSSYFDFSTNNASNIGGTIGGTTAPIIGLISIFLIYFTYSAQQKATQNADEKRNYDILYTLLKDTKERFFSLSYKNIGISGVELQDSKPVPTKEKKRTVIGKQALIYFKNDIIINASHYEDKLPFQKFTAALNKSYRNEITEVLDSLLLIEKKANDYNMSHDEKDLLLSALNLFYEKVLKNQLSSINQSIKSIDKIEFRGIKLSDATEQLINLKETITKTIETFA